MHITIVTYKAPSSYLALVQSTLHPVGIDWSLKLLVAGRTCAKYIDTIISKKEINYLRNAHCYLLSEVTSNVHKFTDR